MNDQPATSQSTMIEAEQTQYNEEQLQALRDAPVLHEWSVIAPPFPLHVMACVFLGAILPLIGLAMAISEQAIGYFLVFLVIGIALGFFFRYLCMSDKLYHYQLTPLGVHFTIQDVIPDAAYTVVRVIAWGGVLLCIIAVAELGVLAFAGAGGMALLALKMTSFSKQILKSNFFFTDNCEIRVLRKHHVFTIKGIPLNAYVIGTLYCEIDKADETLGKLLPYLKDYSIEEVTSCRDL